jgi:hypothetical protein
VGQTRCRRRSQDRVWEEQDGKVHDDEQGLSWDVRTTTTTTTVVVVVMLLMLLILLLLSRRWEGEQGPAGVVPL